MLALFSLSDPNSRRQLVTCNLQVVIIESGQISYVQAEILASSESRDNRDNRLNRQLTSGHVLAHFRVCVDSLVLTFNFNAFKRVLQYKRNSISL